MQVFIMRHGEAIIDMTSDSLRTLTMNGNHESRYIATWLNTNIVDIERVLISPYLRTKKTLEVIRQFLTLPQEEILIELNPKGNVHCIIDYLYILAIQEIHCVLIISHLPLIKKLVTSLCPEAYSAMFVTASLTNICLSTNGHSQWKWQISPQ